MNEQHEFLGTVNTAQEQWRGYVENNPGASFEVLQKERDKMMTTIKAAGQKVTTGIAKQWVTNWYKNNVKMEDGNVVTNEGLIYIKSQRAMEKVVSKQESQKSDILLEQAIANFDKETAAHLIQKQSGKRYPAKTVPLIIEQVNAEIDAKQHKFLMEQLKVNIETQAFALAAEQGYPAAEEMLRNPAVMTQLLEAGVKREDARSLLNDVRERVKFQQAQEKEKLANQQKEDRQAILDKFLKKDYAEIDTFIDSTQLTPEEKLDWIEKAERRAEAINNGKEDPFNQTDNATYFELRRKIQTDPGSVTEEDLAGYVGKGKKGGISIDNYEKLLGMITDKDNLLNKPIAIRSQTVIARLREIVKKIALKEGESQSEIEFKYLTIANNLDQWILDNPEATDEEIEKKVRTLTRPVIEEVTLGLFSKFWRKEKGGQFFGLISSEERALVNKKIDKLKELEIWDTLSDEDKESAKRAFKRGATVQQIIEGL